MNTLPILLLDLGRSCFLLLSLDPQVLGFVALERFFIEKSAILMAMNWNIKTFLGAFSSKSLTHLLLSKKEGFEKETMRIDRQGNISTKMHPKKLGSSLTNPFVTTDFAEAQLELITPPMLDGASCFLSDLHTFVAAQLKDELFWPLSMPPKIPLKKQVKIASFGSSERGKEKELYRKGLVDRYGFPMQLVSGFHYNFSFGDDFWTHLHQIWGNESDKVAFISDCYFHMIRNFYREGWLITYLFGASPHCDASYEEIDLPYATSLRMSHFGYYSRVQRQLAISYDSLGSYLFDLKKAIQTPHKEYQDPAHLFGLNRNILQISNEHYTRIRPKQTPLIDETPLGALENRGVSHLEIRSLDCNPLHPLGVSAEETTFLQLFLIYCLCKKSPKLTKKEQQHVCENQERVALYGRDPTCKLFEASSEKPLKTVSEKILDEMQPIADLLGDHFRCTLKSAREKIEDPTLTPSAIILAKSRPVGFAKWGLEMAKKHMQWHLKNALSDKREAIFTKTVKNSLDSKSSLEKQEMHFLRGYEDLQLSTQIVIREAIKRKLCINIIDRKENFISISDGKRAEYVKEATKTAKDSYISYLMMENKLVSKRVLTKHGLVVPEGGIYSSVEGAKNDYSRYEKSKVVIKPNTTNCGVGIHFVEPGDTKSYEIALVDALTFSESILIEEYIKGPEYRFLIVGSKLIGIIKREPANIVGDGTETIANLIKEKNLLHKMPDGCITFGTEEKWALKKQDLSNQSILPKGKKIYLRENSNVSTGGDAIDMTDEMPEFFKTIAQKAAKSFDAKICGVDMIIPSLKKEAYSIIEINHNPMLSMHEYPFKGKSRNTGAAVLDFLGFSEK